MTQQQLAEKIHKERPLISHIERTGKIHHQTFLQICKALKVSPEQLEFASDEPVGLYSTESTKEILNLKIEIANLKNELRLKDEIIQVLKDHLKALKKQNNR